MERRSFLGWFAAVPLLVPGATAVMGETPAEKDRSRTILMVDDSGILYRSGTKRILRPLDRHPGNPLLPGRDKPWEVAVAWNSVYRDPDTGLYQLWYQAYSGAQAHDPSHACVACYAESQDGIHWTKPDLGLFSYNGIEKTNIVLVGNAGHSVRYGASVVVDPRDEDLSRRYKMAYFDFSRDEGREYPGLSVAFSPDGKRWTKHSKAPLLRAAYGNRGADVPYADETDKAWLAPLSISDATDVMYDPKRGVFAIYGKMWIDGPDGQMFWKHALQRTESRDFVHWTRPELVLTPDELDPEYVEFHTAPVFLYNDTYFALLQILNRAERGGIMDIELAVSRDGLRWDRPFRRPFFLARNPEGGFDGGSIFNNPNLILHGDEMRFYYGGYSEGATGANDYELTTGIGLATMPRDRFASVRPVHDVGQITLKPALLGGGRSATLNADASGGSIRVEVLDDMGRRVRGFAKSDAQPISGDSLAHPVQWGARSFRDLPEGQYMLRLHLAGADVFGVNLQ